MKLFLYAFWTILLLAVEPLVAQSVTVDVDPAPGAPGQFAAEEIRREAAVPGRQAGAFQISIGIAPNRGSNAAPQAYSVRVQKKGDQRKVAVLGTDPARAMYGGLDIAEAIRTGTLRSLEDSDHQPHIAKRGIKFNIPLDLRTPSYTDPCDASQTRTSPGCRLG